MKGVQLALHHQQKLIAQQVSRKSNDRFSVALSDALRLCFLMSNILSFFVT